MYTLYRSPVTFYECLITVVIALLCYIAAQKNLYYPLYIDITASNIPQMKIKAIISDLLDSYRESPKNVGVNLEISLLDCLTTKKFQDFSRTFPKYFKIFQKISKYQLNSRTCQDSLQILGLSRTFQDFPGLVGTWPAA